MTYTTYYPFLPLHGSIVILALFQIILHHFFHFSAISEYFWPVSWHFWYTIYCSEQCSDCLMLCCIISFFISWLLLDISSPCPDIPKHFSYITYCSVHFSGNFVLFCIIFLFYLFCFFLAISFPYSNILEYCWYSIYCSGHSSGSFMSFCFFNFFIPWAFLACFLAFLLEYLLFWTCLRLFYAILHHFPFLLLFHFFVISRHFWPISWCF